jgi:dynein heavy chain 1
VSRKRSEKFIPIKITPAHAKLQERIAFLRAFRRTHEQLRVMTGPTRGLKSAGGALADIDMEEEVRLSYETVKSVDVLDVSIGECPWLGSVSNYYRRYTDLGHR